MAVRGAESRIAGMILARERLQGGDGQWLEEAWYD